MAPTFEEMMGLPPVDNSSLGTFERSGGSGPEPCAFWDIACLTDRAISDAKKTVDQTAKITAKVAADSASNFKSAAIEVTVWVGIGVLVFLFAKSFLETKAAKWA